MRKQAAKPKPSSGKKVKVPTARIFLLLDETGSMTERRAATVAGINDFLKAQRAEPGPCFFSLVLFSLLEGADFYRPRVSERPMARVEDLGLNEYNPDGYTPLYDAVARAIKHLDGQPEADRTLLVIMTDGLENASKEHTLASVKALLKAKQDAGWAVMFLGATLDSAQGGRTMGVSHSNTVAYAAAETQQTLKRVSVATLAYRRGETSSANLWAGQQKPPVATE
jgi:hypothetical protein